MMEYLRMSGVYWCLTCMDLMHALDTMPSEEQIVDFITHCRLPSGGFAASPGHDPHLLHTLSAIQVLYLEYGICGSNLCEGAIWRFSGDLSTNSLVIIR